MAGFSFDLTGRNALITGASSGFGERFGRLLSGSGANVALGARRIDKLEALASEIGDPMDVMLEADIIAGFDAAQEAFGTVDTVVANAGIDGGGLTTDVSEEEIERTLSVNLKGAILTAREGARRMIANKVPNGRIVMIASITAFEPSPTLVAYSASKAGVVQAARSMAREWARTGISIHTISPGYIRTAINEEWFDTDAGQRLMGMEGLDATLLMLCSDAAEFITGADFVLDDGQTL